MSKLLLLLFVCCCGSCAPLQSQLEASEQQVDMLHRGMVTMTRVATLLVGHAQQKQSIQQQMREANMSHGHQHISEAQDFNPHSPQIYKPAVMVSAGQYTVNAQGVNEQQGVMGAEQRALAVVTHPAEALDGTTVCR
jgi:hypothetical protein